VLDLPLIHAGKVRRLYEAGDGRILLVATDAISAFDFVLSTPIPDKGKVLTQLSLWWFEQLDDLIPNHVISTDVPAEVAGRAVLVEPLEMVPVECVARGYLTGSGWQEYRASGSVTGIPLPDGLQDGSRLPEPIFTPAIKAPLGEHDENVDFATIVALHGEELATRLKDATLALYGRAERIARERGIILADTKFEFGLRPDGTLVLADEVLTPDSSRFWDAAGWQPGRSLPSFDKQFVRDWLAHDSGWDRASETPPPPLPEHIVRATRERYLEAYRRLTGRDLSA
jgi:phosphoribosylaminoimidazole-succinocarboxamide synthase